MTAQTDTLTGANWIARTQVRETLVLISLSLFAPFMVHLLPTYDDQTWGARLLPIFYAPLIAAFCYRPHVSLLVCLLPPWLNHVILGMPTVPMAILLSFELLTFTIFARLMANKLGRMAFIGPLAYLLTKPFTTAMLFMSPGILPMASAAPLAWAANTTIMAIPGLLILAGIGWATKHLPNDPHGPAAA